MNHSARRNRRRFAVVIAVMILVLAGVAIGLHLRGGQEPGSQPVEMCIRDRMASASPVSITVFRTPAARRAETAYLASSLI